MIRLPREKDTARGLAKGHLAEGTPNRRMGFRRRPKSPGVPLLQARRRRR